MKCIWQPNKFYKSSITSNKMKRGVWLQFILAAVIVCGVAVLSSFSVSSLGTDCLDSQVIMRIDSASNAHGELWNGSGNNPHYNLKICYDQIFSKVYSSDSPHTPSLTNTVLKLSSPTNAHAEGATGTNYGYNVSYGDLLCRVVDSNVAKNANECEIVSLSSQTNAHIALPGAYNLAGNKKVLCSSTYAGASPQCGAGPAASMITAAYWTDLAGNMINETCVNRTVRLVAETSHTDINFSIYEDDSIEVLGLFKLMSNRDIIAENKYAAVSNGKAAVSYKITPADLALGAGSGDSEEFEFYFIAKKDLEGRVSPILKVYDSVCSSGPPIASIGSPLHRQIYFAGVPLDFKDNSTSGGSPLVGYNWTIIKDGTVEYTSNQKEFQYTFSTGGQRTITERVTAEDGQYSEAQVAILVISSPGMIAYINQPTHRQILFNGLNVEFNANESYVINSEIDHTCSENSKIVCLAGICPAMTINAPAVCTSKNPPVITLSVQNTPQGFSNLYFNWTFEGGWSYGGYGAVSDVYPYALPSKTYNDKKITLSLNYSDSAKGVFLQQRVDRMFTLLSKGRCLDNPKALLIVDEKGLLIGTKSFNEGGCAGPDGIAGSSDDCYCGRDQSCVEIQGTPQCVLDESEEEYLSCGDYKEQSICEEDPAGVANDPNNPEIDESPQCGEIVDGYRVVCDDLRCEWDNSESQCVLEKDYISLPGDGGILTGTCQVSWNATGACENGFRMGDLIKTFVPPASLPTGAQVADDPNCITQLNVPQPCGRATVEVPFFSWTNLIVALVIIFGIYLAVTLRKRNSKRK